jgi:hypothetical protein
MKIESCATLLALAAAGLLAAGPALTQTTRTQGREVPKVPAEGRDPAVGGPQSMEGVRTQNQPEQRSRAAAASGPPPQPYGDGRPFEVQFTENGEMVRPTGWRDWPYVGTPLTPNGLNPPEAPFPEFHNVYMEPSAYDHYKRTGEFKDGTLLVKELVGVQKNNTTNQQDGSTVESSGRGYFMSDYIGLETEYKSSRRYPNEPGNWAYFSFGHVPEAQYAAATAAQPKNNCNACHQANAQQDYVFTQHYPVLRGARERVGRR